MKMEVLSVQNQFQGQFGVMGSAKVKDWTTPLTPPSTHRHHHHNHHQELPTSLSHSSSSTHNNNNNNKHHTNNNNNSNTNNNATNTPSNNINHHNNNNRHNVNTQTAIINNIADDDTTLQALSMRLQNELRTAKSQHLACTEVLLPADLLHRVASEMIVMSEKEPCGIRGCTVYIEFEDEPSNTRRIASLQVDPNTVSTFELYLTLKHDRSGWTSILPQFLKNLARSSTIMISPDFIITKNKLYRSFSE